MPAANFNDLTAFLAVAREESFTRGADRLGLSASALSHTIRGMEERLGVRLFTRTTRRVALTAAGERLLTSVGPLLDEIELQVAALGELRDRPAGIIRLTCTDHVSEHHLHRKLVPFLRAYPDIRIEILLDYGLTDIVGERIDAGIRQGELLGKDMIAVRIGPDWRFSLVGAPSYFEHHPIPQTPHELAGHNCAGLRLTTSGRLWAWEFEKDGKPFSVRVEGQLTYNSIMPGLQAARDGLCLAYLPDDLTREPIARGELIEVLEPWSVRCEGLHIFYPNRRQPTAAFSALLEALRHRA
ncbi:LysR family transcriptional regulator [Azorhizobium oxalatiphilum]|uniref:LysR family transcriptional regulator n=1 Tax=Azorhizobium oxalatiphilum TaxID=980631 RepID=A0A917BPU7_9HYPH|nr:LysR family transcriptional regulator [Azorhizobium oxalatiphilum]GGF52249.1 LysR family transcriptional regulator [Azorhizobium oxalatiphilum]